MYPALLKKFYRIQDALNQEIRKNSEWSERALELRQEMRSIRKKMMAIRDMEVKKTASS